MCSSGVASFRMVVHLYMMIRGVEDLQLTHEILEKNWRRAPWLLQIDCGWTFCDVSANLQISATWNHHSHPQISETVCEVGPKIVDRPTQVKSGKTFWDGTNSMEINFLCSIVTGDETWMQMGKKRFSTNEEVEKWTKGLAGSYFEEGIKKTNTPVHHLHWD